jgi:hypothetical protein
VADHASEFEWRADGGEAELVVHAPDARTADRALERAFPATLLPGAESPLHAVAAASPAVRAGLRFGLAAASGTHAAPALAGAPGRGLLLVADVAAADLGMPDAELPRLVERRLSEVALPNVADAEVRALAERGALWAAEAGLVEEDDLPHLSAPSDQAAGDPDALGRRALLAGARDWTRPGRVGAFRVAEVVDADGADSLGLGVGALVFVIVAGGEDLGRLGLAVHAERISTRLNAGSDFGASRALPAAPRDSEEARDLLTASAAAANYAAGRAALLAHALRRALGNGIAGNLSPRAGWAIGGLSGAEGTPLLLHRDGFAAVGEGAAFVSGTSVAAGTGAMRENAPPFDAPPTEDGRHPWEEAGLLARWATLAPLEGTAAG